MAVLAHSALGGSPPATERRSLLGGTVHEFGNDIDEAKHCGANRRYGQFVGPTLSDKWNAALAAKPGRTIGFGEATISTFHNVENQTAIPGRATTNISEFYNIDFCVRPSVTNRTWTQIRNPGGRFDIKRGDGHYIGGKGTVAILNNMTPAVKTRVLGVGTTAL